MTSHDTDDLFSDKLVACFHFLYVDLKLGQKTLPWDLFMLYTGIYITNLPPELNHEVGYYIFLQGNNETIHLVQEFKERHAKKFDHYFQKIFDLLIPPHQPDISIQQLKSGIDTINKWSQSPHFPPFSRALLNFRPVILYTVSIYGGALEFTTSALKNDFFVVITAVRQDGFALKYASRRLKNDDNIVRACVSKYGSALSFASERLQDDEDIVRASVGEYGKALRYASERLQDTEDIVRFAIGKNGNALQYASLRVRNINEIVSAAVSKNGNALQYASERLKNDPAIVKEAMYQTPLSLACASERLKHDKTFLLAARSELRLRKKRTH